MGRGKEVKRNSRLEFFEIIYFVLNCPTIAYGLSMKIHAHPQTRILFFFSLHILDAYVFRRFYGIFVAQLSFEYVLSEHLVPLIFDFTGHYTINMLHQYLCVLASLLPGLK